MAINILITSVLYSSGLFHYSMRHYCDSRVHDCLWAAVHVRLSTGRVHSRVFISWRWDIHIKSKLRYKTTSENFKQKLNTNNLLWLYPVQMFNYNIDWNLNKNPSFNRWFWCIKATTAFIDPSSQSRGSGRGKIASIADAAADQLLHVWLVHYRLVLDLQGVRAELWSQQGKVLQQVVVYVCFLAHHVRLHFAGPVDFGPVCDCRGKYCQPPTESHK